MTEKPGSSLFFLTKWKPLLPELSVQFRSNTPFSHVQLDEFLQEETAQSILDNFPAADGAHWTQYKHYNEKKLGESKRDKFPPLIGQLVDELNSDEFVKWLSTLIGIPELRADPSLEGGGMHQTESGGFLNIHADFQMHPHKPKWLRRCNLILYLNRDWDSQWGGDLELWDKQVMKCGARIAPGFNRAVIFNTTAESLHGYPEPIRCPQHVTRKSLAFYYYTIEDAKQIPREPTRYYSRPGDGFVKWFCVRCDNVLIAIYAWLKRSFHVSDRFASWLLKIFSK